MFTAGNLILQSSHVLLVAAMLARTPRRIRLFIAASGAILLFRALFVASDYATIGLMVVLLGAWLVLVVGDRHEGKRVRFTAVEEAMRVRFLSKLPRGAARQFIDLGLWLRGGDGDVLTHEGQPVTNLYYLVSGKASVISRGREIGTCNPADLIGEATILSGDAATATVTLRAPSTFWCAPTPDVHRFLNDHEALRGAIERSFSNATKEKLRAANLALAAIDCAA